MSVRLFVAVDLPTFLKEQLGQLRINLKHASWVSGNNMHLTLKFLGNVNMQDYKALLLALNQIKHTSFELIPHGVGYFSHSNMVKVLWSGFEKNESLVSLAKQIDLITKNIGEAQKRKFHPHVTLARPKNTRLDMIVPFLQSYSLFRTPAMTVRGFSLYSSKLTSLGSQYTKEASFELQDAV